VGREEEKELRFLVWGGKNRNMGKSWDHVYNGKREYGGQNRREVGNNVVKVRVVIHALDPGRIRRARPRDRSQGDHQGDENPRNPARALHG
jgi:hypothetical protein